MSPVTFTPLMANVILALEPEPEKSGSLYTPRKYESLTRYGRVQAIGPEVRDLKVGQRVLASITAGTELGGGMLVAEKAVIGVVHEAHE